MNLKNVTLFGISTNDFPSLEKAANICLEQIQFGDVVLIKDEPRIKSYKDYNRYMIYNLHEHIKTDFVLTIQHDGYILNPAAWTDDFLKYDYIGAVWNWEDTWIVEGCRVGNGGFSLRSKKFIEESAKLTGYYDMNEDMFLCILNHKELESKGIKFATVEVASKFSIEGGTWTNEFGFHNFELTDIPK